MRSGTKLDGLYHTVSAIGLAIESSRSVAGTPAGRAVVPEVLTAKTCACALVGVIHVTRDSFQACNCAGNAKSPQSNPGSTITKCVVPAASCNGAGIVASGLVTVAPLLPTATVTLMLWPGAL